MKLISSLIVASAFIFSFQSTADDHKGHDHNNGQHQEQNAEQDQKNKKDMKGDEMANKGDEGKKQTTKK